ncbi:MAG: hypothetical protein IKG18_01885 [Atopobiaceae bacterium]|nr:hypothetical protein [Atopobiaceae bacterium]
MNTHDFLSETVCSMDRSHLEFLKRMPIGDHIQFSFVASEDIDSAVLAEKLNDYFKMVGLKIFRNFDDCISSYMEVLNSIVEPRILKEAPTGSAGRGAGLSRAWRYYDRVAMYREARNKTIDNLIDYSRIMLCLYESILENDLEPINNFDYDRDSLDPLAIMESMLLEETGGFFSRKRIDLSKPYEMGACIVVITAIMLATIVDVELEEEYDYE